MYKILIVDDEDFIRKGLISRIEHHGFVFEEIKEAANGREALQIVKEYKPHIVITDVKMPIMDGIELTKKTKEIYPDVKFIIISGYAEFEYAEQALNMGVSGYLLKPVIDSDLIRTMERVIMELDNQHSVAQIYSENEKLQKFYKNITLEQEINQIIHSDITENLLENSQINSFNIEDNNTWYSLALLNIDGITYGQSSYKYYDLEELKQEIINIIDNIEFNCKKIIINNHKDKNQVIVILMHPDKYVVKSNSDTIFIKANKKFNDILSASITIGISDIQQKITNELYRQAKEAFHQRLRYGNGEIYKYTNIQTKGNLVIPHNEIGLLKKYIERYDIGNIQIILQNIFSDKNMKEASGAYIRLIWMEIVNVIIKVANELRSDSVNDFAPELLEVEVLNKFNNIDEIISYLTTIIIDLLKIDKAVDANCKSKIKLAVQYIENHFDEDITLNDLAYMFAMSPNYFSTVFKKEMGNTVVNYIMEVKIKNACKLLKSTKASIVDISSKVGYQDTQYFFRVFKKITGKTPLEYRKKE